MRFIRQYLCDHDKKMLLTMIQTNQNGNYNFPLGLKTIKHTNIGQYTWWTIRLIKKPLDIGFVLRNLSEKRTIPLKYIKNDNKYKILRFKNFDQFLLRCALRRYTSI